jgi:photosystem II stability/assembly factor-like uncharacterized protein
MPTLSKATALALLFVAATVVHAQWQLQSPIPTGRHLNSVYFLTPTHGFVVGTTRQLIETTNGGATWITRMSDELGTDPFYRIYFSDTQHGFITGNGSDSWRTTDGGATWSRMTTIAGGSWYHLDFITPIRGFVGGNGALSFTSDAGATWISRSVYPNCPVMYGMDFRDEQVGLAAGSLQNAIGIFKTTNGGVSWQQKSSLTTNDVLWWTNTIVLGAGLTSISRSTDAGETWSVYATGISTGILELERINTTTLAGVSGKGDVWRSTDEGLTWTQVFDGPGDLPASWSIHFSDAQHGWVVGQSGFIYASDDGGVTWRQVNNGAGVQIYGMEFLTDNFGMAVGHNGYVFRTTNGGAWWEVQKLEVTGQIFGRDESLHGVSIVDSGFAVVAGPGGTVFRTTNGGVSWQSVGYPNLPGAFWIEDVKFTSRNNGWLLGLYGSGGAIYKTTDGGTSWTLVMTNPYYMNAVDFVGSQYGWMASTGPWYYRTTNGGATWLQEHYPLWTMDPNVTDIKFADQNYGWAVGWYGFVVRTTNGGASWNFQDLGGPPEDPDILFSIHVVSPMEAWATGRESDVLTMRGVVYHTTNGGASWSREITSPQLYWGYRIAGSPSRHVWIGGYEGRILKRSGPTGVGEGIEPTAPQAFQLFQNYPNPFNPTTKIKFQIPSTKLGFGISDLGLVSLKVYDVLGREVRTLVNENLQPGTYEVQWDASHQASGLYFYQLKADGFVATKRMVLVK